jgi:hypothetical protein
MKKTELVLELLFSAIAFFASSQVFAVPHETNNNNQPQRLLTAGTVTQLTVISKKFINSSLITDLVKNFDSLTNGYGLVYFITLLKKSIVSFNALIKASISSRVL